MKTIKEKKRGILTASVEIYGFGKQNNSRELWHKLAVDCQRITNKLWRTWIVHHELRQSDAKLRQHYVEFDAWVVDQIGDKPKWPVAALESPLEDSAEPGSFYRIINHAFPEVNKKTSGLLQQAWRQELLSLKALVGKRPGWAAILLCDQAHPSYERPQPIPFDSKNAKLREIDGTLYLEVRVDRDDGTGKSTVDLCELWLNKPKCGYFRSIVKKIMSGEYKWKGSNLLFKDGKWYAALAYQIPRAIRSVGLDAGKILIVRPGRGQPWRVTICRPGKQMTRSWSFGGSGKNIEYARHAISRERAQRKAHYRWAGANQKGHGMDRAKSIWTKLSSRWRDISKRYNHEVTKQLVTLAKRNGCGKIIYCQPKERERDTRYLSNAGRDEDCRMTWDYFQFGTLLAYKCEKEGLEYANAGNRVRKLRKLDNAKRGKRKK